LTPDADQARLIIPERLGLAIEVQRENEEACAAQLPACARTQEPAQLIDEARVPPCGLPLEAAENLAIVLPEPRHQARTRAMEAFDHGIIGIVGVDCQ